MKAKGRRGQIYPMLFNNWVKDKKLKLPLSKPLNIVKGAGRCGVI